jgi:hypothetical protein
LAALFANIDRSLTLKTIFQSVALILALIASGSVSAITSTETIEAPTDRPMIWDEGEREAQLEFTLEASDIITTSEAVWMSEPLAWWIRGRRGNNP